MMIFSEDTEIARSIQVMSVKLIYVLSLFHMLF